MKIEFLWIQKRKRTAALAWLEKRNNEKTKKQGEKQKKNVSKSKESKELREGSFLQQIISALATTG